MAHTPELTNTEALKVLAFDRAENGGCTNDADRLAVFELFVYELGTAWDFNGVLRACRRIYHTFAGLTGGAGVNFEPVASIVVTMMTTV